MLTLAALCTLGSLATASTPPESWSALDAEWVGLSAPFKSHSGPDFGALIRSSLDLSSDEVFADTPGEDSLGFRAQDARLWAQGALGDYLWRISFDFAGAGSSGGDGIGGASLQDAYAKWAVTDYFTLTFGQFHASVARSADTPAGNLLFIERTFIGQAFDVWQPGAQLAGSTGQFSWSVSGQNGSDGVDDDHLASARVDWATDQGSRYEGGYQEQADGNIAVGLGWSSDMEDAIGQGFVLDASTTQAGFTLTAEVAEFEQELIPTLPGSIATLSYTDDANPWAATLSYMLSPQEWEVAARYQDLDDDDETSVISGGLNWYQAGHAAKWMLNVEDRASDIDAAEGTIVRLGLSIGSDG